MCKVIHKGDERMKKLNLEELILQIMFFLAGVYILYRIFIPIINPASIATLSGTNYSFYSEILNQANSSIDLISNSENEKKSDTKSIVFTYLTGIDISNPLTYIIAQINMMSFLDIASIDPGEQGPAIVKPLDESDKQVANSKDETEKVNDNKTTPDKKAAPDKLTTVNANKVDVKKTTLNNKKPLVLIFHTHTTETFKPDSNGKNYSTNLNITVAEVGKKLEYELEMKYGIATLHDSTIHDLPKFYGAYKKSCVTVQKYLKKYPSLKLIIDLHRDGGVARNSSTCIIDKENYAKTLLVAGTNFKNYQTYNKTTQKIKSIFDTYYPGLCKGIDYKSTSFNQSLSSKMILLEIGSNENKLEEAFNTTKITAKVIAKYLGK
jgi:stage II sporulation protein P